MFDFLRTAEFWGTFGGILITAIAGVGSVFVKSKTDKKAKKDLLDLTRQSQIDEDDERNLKMAAFQAENFHDLWELFNSAKVDSKTQVDSLLTRVLNLEVENSLLKEKLLEDNRLFIIRIASLEEQVQKCREGEARTELRLNEALATIKELQEKYESESGGHAQ